MVFSSPIFLFCFLPIVLAAYALVGWRLKNACLLVASLFFYAWGEPKFVLVMLASIAANYVFGRGIDRASSAFWRKFLLAGGIASNLVLLIAFKYANFIVDNLNVLLAFLDLPLVHLEPVSLPLGISFFTFQAMSYIFDVYRREVASQRNPINLALFISLFPQLIAGPIVRYHDIARQLTNRSVRFDDLVYGTNRFVIGLGKKVLIANPVGAVADQIFAYPGDQLPASIAWLGALCYAFQIYFDFSGYSDMAIGLGRIFGFRILENFNYPYISQSVTEFWRRWHISLSTWFRDYLYIPLGGNRAGTRRTYLNLLIVFFLCGLWHGANWTFVVWGLFNGLFLVLERGPFSALLEKLPRLLRHAYLIVITLVAWVFFRAESLGAALAHVQAMFAFGSRTEFPYSPLYLISNDVAFVLGVAAIGSTPIAARAVTRIRQWQSQTERPGLAFTGRLLECAALPVVTGILLISSARLASGTYNPFIYFRF